MTTGLPLILVSPPPEAGSGSVCSGCGTDAGELRDFVAASELIQSMPQVSGLLGRAADALENFGAVREALADLRVTVDLYVSDDVGVPELAESMDKSYAALYPKATG